MTKLITLTVAAGLACCTGARAQTVWVLSSGSLGASGYLPKVNGDESGDFVVVDQKASGTTAMNDQQGTYPGSGHVVTWSSPAQLPMGTGHAPAIAGTIGIDADDFVEVHQGATAGSLYYHLGYNKVPGGPITWSAGVEFPFQGWNPAVTIFDTDIATSPTNLPVILIYQGGENYSALWSVTGSLNVDVVPPAITWGPSVPIDIGYAPSITSCDQWITEVHEGLGGALMYSVALLDVYNGSIGQFSASSQYDTGYNPSITSCGGGTNAALVEVHEQTTAGTGQGTFLDIIGGLPDGSSISWGADQTYGLGCYPTVAAGPISGTIYAYDFIEVHSATCGEASPLTYDFGSIDVPS